MKKAATYAAGMMIGLSSAAMTPAVGADPLVLSKSQMDAITAGESLTEISATADASGYFAQAWTSTNAATGKFSWNSGEYSTTVGQHASGVAVALGSESSNASVSSDVTTTGTPTVTIEVYKTHNIGNAEIAFGFTNQISGAWLQPF